jgi:hypothetical protein
MLVHFVKINLDLISKCVDSTLYRSLIKSLLYIITSTPVITFSVGVCARSQSSPKESHLIAMKRIIKYLNVIIDYGVWFSKDSNLSLIDYSNVDDRKKHY